MGGHTQTQTMPPMFIKLQPAHYVMLLFIIVLILTCLEELSFWGQCQERIKTQTQINFSFLGGFSFSTHTPPSLSPSRWIHVHVLCWPFSSTCIWVWLSAMEMPSTGKSSQTQLFPIHQKWQLKPDPWPPVFKLWHDKLIAVSITPSFNGMKWLSWLMASGS